MMRTLTFLFAVLVSFALNAQEQPKSTAQFVSEIDKKVEQLLLDFTIPGAAVAIIENGEIVLQKSYGFADTQKGIKVDANTGFNIGSISKTLAAWGVMKLVHEGKIELDAPAEKYMTRWHLPASDFDADGVTIRRLLSHTAGLSLHGYPGWSPKDILPTVEESLNGKNNGPGRVEIIMEPGTKYKYSGGGYTMLQLIIEEVSGQKFEDYMQTEILDPLGMSNSSYKIDDKIMAASALEYDNFGEEIDFELFTAQAAAGLHTTLEDFTQLAFASLYRNKDREQYAAVVPDHLIEQMMEAVPQANGLFGYGMGYQVDHVAPMVLSGHGGDNTGWHAIFRVNPETNDGFVVLTNGGRGSTICYQVYCDWVDWKRGEPLGDWCQVKPPVANKLKSIIDRRGIGNIASAYSELKENQADTYDFSEQQLNELGYYYMGKEDLEKSLAIFKLNVETFPDAFNVYDSYGEALLENGDREEAIENYRKSIKLNPGNEHGINVLKKLGAPVGDIIYEMPVEQLKILEGEYLITNRDEGLDQEWKLVFEVKNNELMANDRGYKYKLIPVGDYEFVNPDDGAKLVFDTKDQDALSVLLFGKFTFKKVK